MRKYLTALSLFAALTPLPAMAQGEAPLPVSVSDVRANVLTYDGKLVRVRGQINNCSGATCSICDESMTRDSTSGACVSLGFHDFARERDAVSIRAESDFARIYRFATVTLEARVDGACHRPGIACAGGPQILSKARVVEVEARKTALTGLVVPFDDHGRLATPSAQERGDMLAALRSQLFEHVSTQPAAVFRIPDDGELKDYGLGCICRFWSDCEDKWPDRYFSGFNSPANPFVCHEMQKKNGLWRVLVGLE